MSLRRGSSRDLSFQWFGNQAVFLGPAELALYTTAWNDHLDQEASSTLIGRFEQTFGRILLVATLFKRSQKRSMLTIANWKRRTVIITETCLLYASGNPLLESDAKIRGQVALDAVIEVSAVPPTVFHQDCIVLVRHEHDLHIDCEGLSPSIFITVLTRAQGNHAATVARVIDNYIPFRYEACNPRPASELSVVQATREHLGAEAGFYVLVDLCYLHNVDDWLQKAADVTRLLATCREKVSVTNVPNWLVLVEPNQVAALDPLFLIHAADTEDVLSNLANRSELRDYFIEAIARRHLGNLDSWQETSTGSTVRLWTWVDYFGLCGMSERSDDPYRALELSGLATAHNASTDDCINLLISSHQVDPCPGLLKLNYREDFSLRHQVVVLALRQLPDADPVLDPLARPALTWQTRAESFECERTWLHRVFRRWQDALGFDDSVEEELLPFFREQLAPSEMLSGTLLGLLSAGFTQVALREEHACLVRCVQRMVRHAWGRAQARFGEDKGAVDTEALSDVLDTESGALLDMAVMALCGATTAPELPQNLCQSLVRLAWLIALDAAQDAQDHARLLLLALALVEVRLSARTHAWAAYLDRWAQDATILDFLAALLEAHNLPALHLPCHEFPATTRLPDDTVGMAVRDLVIMLNGQLPVPEVVPELDVALGPPVDWHRCALVFGAAVTEDDGESFGFEAAEAEVDIMATASGPAAPVSASSPETQGQSPSGLSNAARWLCFEHEYGPALPDVPTGIDVYGENTDANTDANVGFDWAEELANGVLQVDEDDCSDDDGSTGEPYTYELMDAADFLAEEYERDLDLHRRGFVRRQGHRTKAIRSEDRADRRARRRRLVPASRSLPFLATFQRRHARSIQKQAAAPDVLAAAPAQDWAKGTCHSRPRNTANTPEWDQPLPPVAPVLPAALRAHVLQANAARTARDKLLQDLQYRDITPEDYELLLELDEQLPKTTADPALLAGLVVVSFAALSDHASSKPIDCSICMEAYTDSSAVVALPACHHVYHEACIRTWLEAYGAKCPLDNRSVEPMTMGAV
ncbi:uncharacterized protein MONBRDRAFT_7117 [Monosiga brevicollis MX1]|uniref:RING-type domain-containing protein n=1 Tax=Monosiga brevicollis TaxID=81824 RepID=A9UVZ3_MONBE|nr:uncharacterized protein MONBRDRAFT_7117 [Monosiga brevicollis MX1]EDQ90473.1 predicted protein [Monosiga brevicollis MX1]|eukprot:XP_001744524.1 hypothetical protein [Monosiga brevicollis MX1]